VTAQARSGIEGHKAEGLGGGGLDHLPDVDAHAAEDLLHLVDQGDVDAAEDILEQFGGLGGAGAADRHRGGDIAVERDGAFAGVGVIGADDFWGGAHGKVLVVRVLALGRKGDPEIDIALSAGLFEDRLHHLVGGARPGARLKNEHLPRAQVLFQLVRGILDVGEVGFAVLVERRRQGDENDIRLRGFGEISGVFHLAEGVDLLDILCGDVLDVALAGAELVDLALIDVEADDGETLACELDEQRQSYIAQSHDAQHSLFGINLCFEVHCRVSAHLVGVYTFDKLAVSGNLTPLASIVPLFPGRCGNQSAAHSRGTGGPCRYWPGSA